jgi:hypothetical protein
MGKDLSQMIEAVADASTGEFERLKEFGIKAKKEGDNVSLTFQGVTKTIGNSAAEITKYLEDIGNVSFGGAMEERAKTLDGTISALGDTWDELFRTISTNNAGSLIFDSVTLANGAIEDAITLINAMSGAANENGRATGAMATIQNGIATVFETVAVLGANLKYVLVQIGDSVGGLAAQVAAAARLDFSGVKAIQDSMIANGVAARKQVDETSARILGARKAAQELANYATRNASAATDPRRTDAPKAVAAVRAVTTATKASAGADREAEKAARDLKRAYDDLLKSAQQRGDARNAEANSIQEYMRAEEQGRIATVKAANEAVRAAQDEYDQYGMTKSQIAEITLARLNDKLAGVNAGTEIAASIQLQIDAQKELIAIMQKGEARDVGVTAAKEAQAEWTKFYDSVYDGLTDSLYRAFEKGGSFFKNFWDGIKNLFKTTVLKLAIQGVVGGVTGALGMSGAANAASGGSGALSMASNASSIYSGVSSMVTLGSQVVAGTMSVANALGTVAANATGTGISGLLAANGAYGTAAAGSASAMAGSATGMLAAIPGIGWAALAAVAVASIFGGRGKKEATGGGIEGNFGNAGFAGNSFSTWKQDGGWFRSDRTGKETGALDSATSKQFTDSYKAVQMAASGAAVALGLSADSITNYSQAISLQLGSDAAANEKAVSALFAGIGDNMAAAVAPGIAQFTKEGETAGGTLSRLAVSLTTANAWLDRFGANMLNVSLAGGDAASKLADLFGGLENLNTASSAFYATYFSEAERAAQSTEDMGKALGALGLALPNSKEAFRALALSMDQTTDAGRAAYATLLLLAPEFATTSDALSTLATEATAAMESLFAKLSSGLQSTIEGIAGERVAVAAAALQINNPGTMSRDAILRGINGTALATPGNAGLSAAQTALSQADAAVAAQAAAVAYAKTQTPSRAALDAAAAAVAAAPAPNRDAYTVAATGFSYVNGEIPTEGWMETSPASFDQAGYDAAVVAASAPAKAAYDAQAVAYSNAAAVNAAQVATEQAKLSAATAAQANAVTAAKNAQLAYITSLQDFAIDASKATAKLGTLREETLKYYDAQKQLADLMTGSAAGLRNAVSAARSGQLDPAQSLAQQQGGFASAYSLALATTGAAQAGYADKLTAALPGLSTALMDTASTREDWARATGTLFAQSEAIAKQLEANAPQDYAADSLAMLGQIDAALMVLDASSKSAEKIIADAVTAGSENTANGLRAVIAALTGSPVPAFALGGSFGGGLRIVGENGPELEATGPSRIFSASQTRNLLGGGNDEMVQELRALRQEVAGLRAEAQATAGHTSKTARLLDRAMPDGDALATRATA